MDATQASKSRIGFPGVCTRREKTKTQMNIQSITSENKTDTSAKKERKEHKYTKIKVFIVVTWIALAYANYYLLKQNYVFQCDEGGYFMSQAKCQELSQNKFDALELARQENVKNNPDIFQ